MQFSRNKVLVKLLEACIHIAHMFWSYRFSKITITIKYYQSQNLLSALECNIWGNHAIFISSLFMTWSRLNIKMQSYQNGILIIKITCLIFIMEIFIPGKMVLILKQSPEFGLDSKRHMHQRLLYTCNLTSYKLNELQYTGLILGLHAAN